MRISDLALTNSHLNKLAKTKQQIDKLSSQISNSVKVQKPSDSPEGIIKILRHSSTLKQNDIYNKNIENGLAFLNESIFAMESIQSEIQGIITSFAELKNISNEQNLGSFADRIELSLASILNSANMESEGKFVFGGTDFSSAPFSAAENNGKIEVSPKDISGENVVKIASNVSQKINFSGKELFGTVINVKAGFDSAAPEGSNYLTTSKIYSASGEEFDLLLTFNKTAANKYSMTYDIQDGNGVSVIEEPAGAVELNFDPVTGVVKGSPKLRINNKENGIDTYLEMADLKESEGEFSSSFQANQKTDIFNTLNNIKNNLRNGIKPSEDEENFIRDFNKHLLDKISEAGNTVNQLTDTQEFLSNQKSVVERLLSNEQDLDLPKAIMELQNQDYLLQMSYKISSMMLPKSLLDYL